jgi:hypothetical protein
MSNEIIVPQIGGEISDTMMDDLDTFTRTTEFLPQIRVYGSESTIVKEGKFPMGHFGLYFTGDNIVDMGDMFDAALVDLRPRASIVMGDQPVSFYGKNNEGQWDFSNEFIEIKDKAMSKVQGYLCGLEYLLWVPSVSKFGLFFMGNPTLRRESANVKALLHKAATFKIKLIKSKTYTWHGAQVYACQTPFDMPDNDDIADEITKFRDPKDSAVELAEASDGSERAR